MRTTGFRSIARLRSAAAVLLAGGLALGCEKAQSAPPPPQVTVAPAISRTVADENESTGRPVAEGNEFPGPFESVNSVEVRPRVGGFVERVAFIEGALVHQGDVLF